MAKVHFGVSPTSVVLRAKLMNSSVTTGAGLTGLTFSASGLRISTIQIGEVSATAYTAAGSTIETITTLGTYAAPTATKCRFKEVDATNHPGIYELQLADARFVSTNTLLVSINGATNLAQADLEVQCSNLASNMTQILGTAVSTPATAGILDVNVKNMNNVAATSITTINANIGQTQPLNFTGTGATAYVKTDMININSAAVVTSAAQIGVNVIQAAGTAWGSGAITAVSIATGAITNAKFAAGAIDAAAIADNAIDNATFAADTVCKNIRSAATNGASTNTVTLDGSASSLDNFYDGQIIQITSGTGVGQSRVILSYVGSTKIATVTENWVTPPTSATYTILPLGDVEVGFIMAGVITSASIATGAITNVKFASGAIDAAAIAADAIGSSEFAQAAADKIWASSTRTLTSFAGLSAIDANLISILGTAVSAPATAGILDVNIKNMNNVAATSITTINANQGTTQPVNYTGTGASALVKSDMVDIAGAAVVTSAAQIGVNVVSQNNIDFGALQKSSLNAATPASVGSVISPVTVGTNNDKLNYTLSASEHTAIGVDAALAILITPANKLDTDISGRTNIGKVYSVSAAARQLSISAPTMADGFVTSASFAPTTTQFESSYITKADANFFTNRTVIFTSGVLDQQARNISGYAKVGSNGRFTVDQLTTAPMDGDSFIIV